jgi:hypothetical protein
MMKTAKDTYRDDEILYTVDGSNNLAVTGTELFVWSGDTYAPGATVNTEDIDIDCILT